MSLYRAFIEVVPPMRRLKFSLAILLTAGLMVTGTVSVAGNAGLADYADIKWEQLVPKDWDPSQQFKGMDFSKLQDGDPKATEMLASLKNAWDAAPAEPSLQGKKIRMPGFLLPLDTSESLKTFLLVPYFGACIHSPPPPANQIVQVVLDKPVKGYRTMDAVWVNGTMEIFRSDSPWGAVGYRLKGVKVEAYKP